MYNRYILFIDKTSKIIKSIQKIVLQTSSDFGFSVDAQGMNILDKIELLIRDKDIESLFLETFNINMWESIFKFQYIDKFESIIENFIPIQTLRCTIVELESNIIIYDSDLITKNFNMDTPYILLGLGKLYSVKLHIFDPYNYLDTIQYLDKSSFNYELFDSTKFSNIKRLQNGEYTCSSKFPGKADYTLLESTSKYFYHSFLKIKFTGKSHDT